MIFDFYIHVLTPDIKSNIGMKAYNLFKLYKEGICSLRTIIIYGQVENDDIQYVLNNFSVDDTFAVRSSMCDEDLANESSAGKYKSSMCVSLYDIEREINDIFLSAIDVDKKAVIIQPVVYGDVSGVIFTKNPVTSRDELVIEATIGAGELLVSGIAMYDRYVISLDNCKVLREKIKKKSFAYIYKSDLQNKKVGSSFEINGIRLRISIMSKNKALCSIHYKDRYLKILNNIQISKIIEVSKKIEKIFGVPQDIEFSIIKDEIIVLQSRNITTNNVSSSMKNILGEFKNENKIYGTVAASGAVKGSVINLSNVNDDYLVLSENRILVVKEFLPEYVYYIDKCEAIICEMGSLLCHAAIVAREKNIPCLVEVERCSEIFKTGDKVIVDAIEGWVTYDCE